MTLLDELRADGAYRPSCSVCSWLESREPDERVEWQQAMADKTFAHTSIWRAMKKRGYNRASSKPIESHRNDGHDGH